MILSNYMIDKDNEKHSNNKRDFKYQVSLLTRNLIPVKKFLKLFYELPEYHMKESHACGITLQNCTHTDTHNSHIYPHTDTHKLTRLPTHRHTHTISSTQKSHILKKING